MAEYDGSLKFDTSLDNSGFEAGSDKLLKAIDNLTKAINSMGQQMGSAFQSAGPAIKSVASAAKSGADTATAATDKYTAALEKQQAKIDAAQAKLEGYREKSDRIYESLQAMEKVGDKGTPAYEKQAAQLDEINIKIQGQEARVRELTAEYERLAAAMREAGQGTGTDAGGGTPGAGDSEAAGDAAERSGEKAQKSSKMWAALGSAIGATGKKALSAAGWFAKLPFQALASSVKSFTSNIKQSFSPTDKLVKSLTSLKRLLITRIKRMFISEIFNQAKESLRALALFSSDFNAAMSSIQNSSKETAGNLAVSIGGAIRALQPAISGLISLINSAIVAINRLFAILGGKSTMTVAKKQTDDYAKSLSGAGGAAKDAAKQLLGFDEIMKLESRDSGGGGGGDAAEDLFEEADVDAPDFSSWGEAFDYLLDTVLGKIPALKEAFLELDDTVRDWANKLYEMFTFPGVKEKVQQLGAELAGAFNELVANFPWSEVGHALGAGLELALTFLVNFIYTFDWMQLGDGLAQMINGIVEEIDWYEFGQLLWAKFKIALELLAGFILGLNMPELAEAASNIIIGFLDSMTDTIKGIDWSEIGRQIARFLNNVDFVGIVKSAVTSISGIVSALLDLLIGFVQETDWGKLANQLWNSLATVVNDIPWTSLVESAFELLGSAIAGAVSFIMTLGARIGEAIHEAFLQAKDYFMPYIEEMGGDVLGGILFGIIDAIKGIGGWIKEHIFQPFIDGFKKVFKIGSPSKVMEEQGGFIVDGFLNGINAFANIANDIAEWGKSVLDWFTGGDGNGNIIKKFETTAGDIVSGFKSKISSTYTTVKSSVTTWASGVVKWFTNGDSDTSIVTRFENTARDIVSGFGEKIGNTYTSVKSSITTWASGVHDWFTGGDGQGDILSKFQNTASGIVDSFKNKISSTYETAKDSITTWSRKLSSWFEEGTGTSDGTYGFENIAMNVVNGFANGISKFASTAINAVTNWAGSIISSFQQKMDEHSPSKVFYQLGAFLVEGLNEGIDSEQNTSVRAVSNLASTIVDAWDGVNSDTQIRAQALTAAFSDALSKVREEWSELRPFVTSILDGISADMHNRIGTLQNTLATSLSAIETGIRQVLYQIQMSILLLFDSMTSFLRVALNNMSSMLNAWSDSVIVQINNIIEKYNQIAGFFGGQRIERATSVHIPMLADGAVIQPNNPYLAVVGDQKSGVNIETPLRTMISAFNASVSPLAAQLAAIEDNVTPRNIGIASGAVIPYKVVAALQAGEYNYRGSGDFGGGEPDYGDILREILSAIRAGKIIEVDKRQFGEVVADANNLNSRRTGIRIGESYA